MTDFFIFHFEAEPTPKKSFCTICRRHCKSILFSFLMSFSNSYTIIKVNMDQSINEISSKRQLTFSNNPDRVRNISTGGCCAALRGGLGRLSCRNIHESPRVHLPFWKYLHTLFLFCFCGDADGNAITPTLLGSLDEIASFSGSIMSSSLFWLSESEP